MVAIYTRAYIGSDRRTLRAGFDKPANPNALGTLEEAKARVASLPVKPSFMIHTGDISHLEYGRSQAGAGGGLGNVLRDVLEGGWQEAPRPRSAPSSSKQEPGNPLEDILGDILGRR